MSDQEKKLQQWRECVDRMRKIRDDFIRFEGPDRPSEEEIAWLRAIKDSLFNK